MKKCITLLMLIGGYACMAQAVPGKLQLSVASGYSQEDLRWSIAGNANGQNLNTLSALRWEKVGGSLAGMNVQFKIFDHWQLEGGYEHVFYLSGKVYDTDYGGNDRTNIIYAEQFNAGKGGTDRWQAGLAYKIPLTNRFSITPSAGYGQFQQALYITGNTADLPELNSIYKTTWGGPYGQVVCATGLTKKISMNTAFRYSQVRYKASANWNLIREFNHPESFRHTANGYGINIHTSILYRVSGMHSIGIKGIYSHWQTGRGIDELYLANGGLEQTQLNEVRSASWQVMVEWRISLMTNSSLKPKRSHF